jgi:hypothetical protein
LSRGGSSVTPATDTQNDAPLAPNVPVTPDESVGAPNTPTGPVLIPCRIRQVVMRLAVR